jgi:chromate transporter
MKRFHLFAAFFRIGLLTVGGGYVMVPLIEKEVVRKRAWLKDHDFLDMLAIAQSVPGVLAINTAVFVGYKVAGISGALCAALGCILPSFVVLLAIAFFFTQIHNNEHVERIFKGIRPAVVGLIAASVWNMAKKMRPSAAAICIICVVALLIWLCSISPIWLIMAAAIVGVLRGWYKKKKKS